jgi:tRNA modification GTPase
VDTAGYRISEDTIELEGIRRTKIEIDEADLLLLIIDTSMGIDDEDLDLKKQLRKGRFLTVFNKIDIAPSDLIRKNEESMKEKQVIKVSALNGEGLEELKQKIVSASEVLKKDRTQSVVISSLRHKDALSRAKRSLLLARKSLKKEMSSEFVALDVIAALGAIGEVVGKTVTDDILNKIFSELCIGK